MDDRVNHVIDMPESGYLPLPDSSAENRYLPHQEEDARVRNDQARVVHSPSLTNRISGVEPSASLCKVYTSIKVAYKMSIIITSVILLVMSRHEKLQNPLFAWILGYLVGCAASIPITLLHCSRPHPRLFTHVDRCIWLLELFFAVWLMVGTLCFNGENYSFEAPNLYSLFNALVVFNFIKFLALSTISAMALCCCSDHVTLVGEALSVSITCRCRVVAKGTVEKRLLLREDAVCCICLASYDAIDELKELPCLHLFHTSCVDKWLKIKASCPLCKCMLQKSDG